MIKKNYPEELVEDLRRYIDNFRNEKRQRYYSDLIKNKTEKMRSEFLSVLMNVYHSIDKDQYFSIRDVIKEDMIFFFNIYNNILSSNLTTPENYSELMKTTMPIVFISLVYDNKNKLLINDSGIYLNKPRLKYVRGIGISIEGTYLQCMYSNNMKHSILEELDNYIQNTILNNVDIPIEWLTIDLNKK